MTVLQGKKNALKRGGGCLASKKSGKTGKWVKNTRGGQRESKKGVKGA